MARVAHMAGVFVMLRSLFCFALVVESHFVFPGHRRAEGTDDRHDRSTRQGDTEKSPEEGDRELHGHTVPERQITAYPNAYGFHMGSRGRRIYTDLPDPAVPTIRPTTHRSARQAPTVGRSRMK